MRLAVVNHVVALTLTSKPLRRNQRAIGQFVSYLPEEGSQNERNRTASDAHYLSKRTDGLSFDYSTGTEYNQAPETNCSVSRLVNDIEILVALPDRESGGAR